jgi:DNA-binding PadR family transcriptional regulator
MIEQELLLLGLLREGPKHGYEIKKKIKEILSLFSGVDLRSIYYPLRVLEKKGFLEKRITKQGRRPERMVYELTPRGESHFKELLTQSFLSFKRPQFSLDLSLYFLDYIKPKIAQRRLRARKLVLEKLARGLRQMANPLKKRKPSSLSYILEHDLRMVETESKFLDQLIRTL